ncbi:hypothetical protein [Vibrio parahaemolyticus]|uniref:hypothetical protein n=1 Tax=Vibrio parahaemolyticus TaxID=670 RepID=UPI000943C9AB|nr:hypothetical protein [Vibrio parahaemolyticus]MQD24063.1 hypothetical protein [Vibrio parahaemolyticus]OKY33990.1 hypothetical protein BUE73_21755 [Vibrio parahaemolyticus]OKY34887.1 hypothetical protein BUE11_21255 [Vibrio parahaemolyticus]RFD34749.1 hypothetical protein BKD11_04985 [Vibrio parahaemolyticus]HCE2666375.1 hypothetical protein [Vibrio parahaemolyticus]
MLKKYIISIMLAFISITSFNAYSAQYDVKICDVCTTDDSFFSFAKQHSKFMTTVEFHVYNSKTDVLKKFRVTNRQELLPNGEPLFHTTAALLSVDQQLRADMDAFLVKQDEIGAEVVAQLSRSLNSLKDLGYIRIPESMAKSPWDLVGKPYVLYDISQYLNPGSETAVFWTEMEYSKAMEFALFGSAAFNMGMTQALGIDWMALNKVTIKFSSGALLTFSYTFDGIPFNLSFNAEYPILDSNGNIVADSPKELQSIGSLSDEFRFLDKNGLVDKEAFTRALERSDFSVIDNGSVGDGFSGWRCYKIYINGTNSGITCSRL